MRTKETNQQGGALSAVFRTGL